MKNLLAISIVILSSGCTDPTAKTTSQSELENIAHCFHASATLLQSQPDKPTDIASFLRQGKTALQNSGGAQDRAPFDALRWSTDGTLLITKSGKVINCQIVYQEHDNYGSDGTSWITEYEFSAADIEFRSRTTLRLHMEY